MIYKNFIISDELQGFARSQTGLFTPAHEKHVLKITIKTDEGKKYTKKTTYQFNPKYTSFKNGDGLLAVVVDARCVADFPGFHDFCLEFGYSVNDPKARRAFNTCKASLQFFLDAGLTVEDLGNLQEQLDA